MEKFVVSARKYRPITFESVVGQQHITSTLRNAISTNQVAHAYLFCGPRGVGKTTCARILSKSLNCLNPQPGAEACGECESCSAFNENRSFNIHELDAASNNSVDYIRSLNDQVRTPPHIGKYSIYIIDEAHMLSTAAFNAFLKTLEEPPAHAIFILATTEKHKILPTILSRCQIYDFKRIKVEDMVNFLGHISSKEGVTFDDESLHIISQKSDGCMRDALSMYDKVVSFCGKTLQFKSVAEAVNVLDYDSYFTFTNSLINGDYSSSLLQFDEVLQKGFDSMTFLAGLSNHLRNLLVAADKATISLLEVTGSVAKRYTEQTTTCNPAFIFNALNVISIAEGGARSSLNIRLLTELTILKLCNLSPNKISGDNVDIAYKLPLIDRQNTITSAPVLVSASAPAPALTPIPAQAQAPEPIPAPVSAPVSTPAPVSAPTPPTTQKTEESEIINTTPTTIVEQVTKPPVTKPTVNKPKSLLGSSISIKHKEESIKEETPTQNNDNEPTITTKIKEEDYDKVIKGCKEYATRLRSSRPRLSMAFEFPKIEDGELIIEAATNLLKDQLISNRHQIINELIVVSGVANLNYTVVVNEKVVQAKAVLIRDDDKLKFLTEQNNEVERLCSALKLDFI